jgi:hypothetical protein
MTDPGYWASGPHLDSYIEYSHDAATWYTYGDPIWYFDAREVDAIVRGLNEVAEQKVAAGSFPYPARYWRAVKINQE